MIVASFFKRFVNAKKLTIKNILGGHSENQFTIIFPIIKRFTNRKEGFIRKRTSNPSQSCGAASSCWSSMI